MREVCSPRTPRSRPPEDLGGWGAMLGVIRVSLMISEEMGGLHGSLVIIISEDMGVFMGLWSL